MKSATKLVSTLFLLILLAGRASPSATTSSDSAAPPDTATVVLTPAEVDSITAALVKYEVRLRLLQVDLDECREVSLADSAAAARALEAERMPWWEKTIRHPILWFCVGAYLGMQAASD